jgi:orotate phosphoribosyltransferase
MRTLASEPSVRHNPRPQALTNLQENEVLMLDGHFDYGNGFHGRVYLNPHRIFRQPSLIWRFAQDLIDILPESISDATDVVAGPVMGGALLAHTIAGLLDGRRSLTRPRASFAPLSADAGDRLVLRPFYQGVVRGQRVLVADDVRNTGKTFERAKTVIEQAGGMVIATVEIYDRLEAIVELGVPNFALAEYKAPENYAVADCPMCQAGTPITSF